ncbi:MAG TPA: hypothetical protein VM597_11450, partial [Gemmataceae bacterium]|nr:hypothetical protein [Gemmataceae bacterium]
MSKWAAVRFCKKQSRNPPRYVANAGPRSRISCSVIGFPPDNVLYRPSGNPRCSVNTSTTPSVQYAYSFAPSGSTNHSRLTSVTYPNGRVLAYNYASGLADDISRLSSITDGGTTLEGYEYLGVGTVVTRAHPQPGVDLTYVKFAGESDGDAGDKYTG